MANMKKIFIAVMVIGLTFTTIPAFAQTAKDAVLGLKKLQARCQSGISYKDYSTALADAKFPVNLYMESADAKKYLELTTSINKVMGRYELAGEIWNSRFSVDSNKNDMYSLMLKEGYIQINSALGEKIEKLYPQADNIRGYYWIKFLLPMIWEETSKELENTTKLYAKIEGDDDIGKLKKENEKLKKDAESEKLKAENANLKKQLEVLKSKRNK